MTSSRIRADQLLVQRGLFDSRARAQAAIEAGLVTANGQTVRKASESVPPDAVFQAQAPHPYVSRGGVKLAAALDVFGIDPTGLPCLDIGASTGGFTDVLLQRGAAHVTCVDTGRGQLHPRIAPDPRVTSFEAQDIRSFDAGSMPEPPQLIVIDVSFVSLALILPHAARLIAPAGRLIALIKPQFEVGRGLIGKGGIVRDASALVRAVGDVRAAAVDLGWRVDDVVESPVTGGDGNREFLLAAVSAG